MDTRDENNAKEIDARSATRGLIRPKIYLCSSKVDVLSVLIKRADGKNSSAGVRRLTPPPHGCM